MNRSGDLLTGMLLGAGLMYLLDPDRGRRRRALLRDQLVSGMHTVEDLGDDLAGTTRDLQNRARGTLHDTRARLSAEEVDDTVLEARVRSAIGRAVSNPSPIEVRAENGRITLNGPVLAADVSELLATVRSVRGVQEVSNQLQVHEQPGNVSGLQGTGTES
ncbi:MAG: BON domain-containing protein [Gemmatimonadota bacterium]|nr:BON domain-containing protein [Gemmatimonadota bacterium]